jgi:pimeloyl-ACP methyl ester carboxylesterase
MEARLMFRCLPPAVVCWLALLDLLADMLRWRGAQWGGAQTRSLTLAALVGASQQMRRQSLGAQGVALLAALPLALLLQIGLASLRRWRLDPRRRLLPGTTAEGQVTRLDIPAEHGPVPALYMVPHGGARAAVCYVHGSGSDKIFFTWNIAEALLERGLAVLLIDMDGHGESLRAQDFPACLAAVHGAAAWLRERYAGVGLVGMSLGGCVAARAVAEGLPVDALAVVEAPPYLRLSQEQIRGEALRLLRPAILRQFRYGSAYYLIRCWLDTPRIRARLGTWDLIDALDLLGSLRRIGADGAAGQAPPVPLLLVYGGLDAIVPPERAAQVAEARPPWAAFYMFPDASHLSLSIDPRMLDLVCGWFAAQEGMRPPAA